MVQPATLNGLMAATQTELPLPERARQLLSRDTLLVRVIDRGTYGALHPMPPDEVLIEPDPQTKRSEEELNRRYEARLRAWLRRAPAEERIAFRVDTERVKYHAIALAALEPRLTAAEAERLGDDAVEILVGILEFSGLVKQPKPAAAAPAPAEAATDAAVGA